MSLSSAHSAMSDARRTALRRNYETTKLERDAMAKAYSKDGSSLAGNINLQQFDWKLERLADDLREAGEIVDPPKPARAEVAAPVAEPVSAEQPKPEVVVPDASPARSITPIRDAVASVFNRGKR